MRFNFLKLLNRILL